MSQPIRHGYSPSGLVYRAGAPRGGPAVAPPGRGLLIAAGVLAILQAAFVLLVGLVMAIAGLAGEAREVGINGSEADVAAAVGLGVTSYGIMAVLSATFSMTGRPGWTITSGVLQSLVALFWIVLSLVGASEGMGAGEFFIVVIVAILSVLPAVLTFVGIGQASRRRAWKLATRT